MWALCGRSFSDLNSLGSLGSPVSLVVIPLCPEATTGDQRGQFGSSELASRCLLEQGLERRLNPKACAPFATPRGGLTTALVLTDCTWGPVVMPRGRGSRKLSSSEASTRSRKLL